MSLIPEKFEMEISTDPISVSYLIGGFLFAGVILATFYAWVKKKF